MKVIDVSGDARTIGQCTGEALRDEIREHLAMYPLTVDRCVWRRRLPRFLDVLKRCLPDVLDEMKGTAQGAGVTDDEIYGLNFQLYPDTLTVDEGCTNIVFANGPDGPVWGKNNDGLTDQKPRPICARIVRRRGATPMVVFAFCGWISAGDAMNAEGVAIGHSSVGSIFQQSDDHVPFGLWAYHCLLSARTTSQFVTQMASVPTRGKGFSMVCVDRYGSACSIEAPSPLMQVRQPNNKLGHVHCVNCYQLPTLADADQRSPQDKLNAQARWRLLDGKLSEDIDFSVDDMKRLLRHHGDPSICRHGGTDARTEFSVIALPASGYVLSMQGYPCEHKYTRIAL